MEGVPWIKGDSVVSGATRRWHNTEFTRIYQTRFGYPDGNCWAASVASVTGLLLEDIDEAAGSAADWPASWDRMRRFLASRGWLIVYFPLSDDWHSPFDNRMIGFPFLYLLSGTSASGLSHVVVAHSGQVVHNPNRDPEARLVSISGVELLVPITGCELPFGEPPTIEEMEKVMRERQRRRSIPLGVE